jgi:hypothetical protein
MCDPILYLNYKKIVNKFSLKKIKTLVDFEKVVTSVASVPLPTNVNVLSKIVKFKRKLIRNSNDKINL